MLHEYPDRLVISLVEGVKLPDPVPVVVSDTETLGPYYPVKVLAESRCIAVTFDQVLTYQVVDESYSAPQSEMPSAEFLGPVRECQDLSYRRYIEGDSLLAQLEERAYRSYYIWTEDQTFFVISAVAPSVELLARQPDLSIERHNSYAAE